MIELSGNTPELDIVIEITGLKPGEKPSDIWSDDVEEFRPRVTGIMELLLSRDRNAGRLAVIEMPVQ
jgi:O-antigen biosynthesis protein WbqV